jgi:hypothetical protein
MKVPRSRRFRSTVFLPKLAQPTTLFPFRYLVELSRIQPDAMASRALIDGYLLEAALSESLTALGTFHVARGLGSLLAFSGLFAFKFFQRFPFFFNEIFIFLTLFSLVPFIRHG